MTKSENATENTTRKKSSGKQQASKEKLKPPTKIVIRHLPPTMTEAEFLKQIDPLPAHEFYYYAAADWSLGFDATCRAYITLKNYDDVFLFRDRFDGYVFVDAKGAEYPAIVEFAPFQGLVKNKSRRSDNKVNTIEEESHYQQFLVKLTEEREAAAKGGECKLEFNLNTKKEEITSTPLLQYLANIKEKRRQEAKKRSEEKRRQREEEKERRRQAAAKQTQQVTRIIGAAQGLEKQEDNEQSKENKRAAEKVEEKQNARSRRRNERNQRRQEAFLQRKLDEKAGKTVENVKDSPVSVESKPESIEKASENVEKKLEKKDNKTTDVKRDRERDSYERNRTRRGRRERGRQKVKDTTDNEAKDIGTERRMSGSQADMSKSVCAADQSDNNKAISHDSKMLDNEQKKLQAAEERRIRNKDRPSIAIYQPKARLRPSEESDNGRQSDGETCKEKQVESVTTEETPRLKKVSRYSERRNERRIAVKEKQKSVSAEEESVSKPKELEN